jgi:hypothetical protein
MTTEAIPTVGALLDLLRHHDVPDDARLTGAVATGAMGSDVFVAEIKLVAGGESTVLRIGRPVTIQQG